MVPFSLFWVCFLFILPFSNVRTGDAYHTYQTIAASLQSTAAASPPEHDGYRESGADCFQAMADLVPPQYGPLEEHFVTTSDGYILRLFRIRSRSGVQDERRVVYLQHALLDSSAGWVVMGPNNSLAFQLSDAGYDVWMGNVRGNRFSRNHTHLNPDTDVAYWDFSFDEFALIDLPTCLHYVRNVTGAHRLSYVGYSQGTTMALALLSSTPCWDRHLHLAVLLAPVAFVTHITSTLFLKMAHWQAAEWFDRFGVAEFGGHHEVSAEMSAKMCRLSPWLCTKWMQLLCGANPRGNLDAALLPRVMHYLPAGTSVRNMQHWGQAVRSADRTTLRKFDFGNDCEGTTRRVLRGATAAADGPAPPKRCNMKEYGQQEPPAYNLTRITTPLALFTGGQDSLSDPADVSLLLSALTTQLAHYHYEPDYAHLDFGLGADAGERLYPRIIQVLEQGILSKVKVDSSGSHISTK